jgi:anti-sigma B factor antagonist
MTDDSMRHEIERADRGARVRIFGALDMNGTLRLEQALEQLVDERPERLIIDLSGATFVDSTGMNLLITTEERARREDVEVELVRGPREVMQVFEVTGLVDVLPFRPEPS